MSPIRFRRSDDELRVRAGSAVKRDVYKAATAGLTGATAFAALAVTGVVAGTAAHAKAVEDAAKTVEPPAPSTPAVVQRRRPHRTVVRTKVIHQVAAASVARPGTGGTVTTPTTSHPSPTTAVTHSAPAPKPVSTPAPKPAPPPAPKPAPKPAPTASAPSSGS